MTTLLTAMTTVMKMKEQAVSVIWHMSSNVPVVVVSMTHGYVMVSADCFDGSDEAAELCGNVTTASPTTSGMSTCKK